MSAGLKYHRRERVNYEGTMGRDKGDALSFMKPSTIFWCNSLAEASATTRKRL